MKLENNLTEHYKKIEPLIKISRKLKNNIVYYIAQYPEENAITNSEKYKNGITINLYEKNT